MTSPDLATYHATAASSASVVIERYSTSFGKSSRLLAPAVRQAVASIYALVRVADELVDGPAEAAGVDLATRAAMLDELEAETARAIATGFSTNLVVHAFAQVARASGIGDDLCRPFFASMRADLTTKTFAGDDLATYIYGSAEVVGLMCLRVFEIGMERTPAEERVLVDGARRLGAAFQKVNFLRDLGADRDQLGRDYVTGSGHLTELNKQAAVAEIRADLAAADLAIELLAPSSKAAVWAARAMFGALADKISETDAATIAHTRVRVPDHVKLSILARAMTMKLAR